MFESYSGYRLLAISCLGLVASLSSSPRACYVHLPFCRRRCFYCSFPIEVVGDGRSAADAAAEKYVSNVLREMRATPRGDLGDAPLESVYFGGGTPSLTPPHLVEALIEELRGRYGLAAECELTLEMDPGTFDAAKLDAFIAAGVNRVSMGVQSFDDALLKSAGRAHDVAEAEEAIDLVISRLEQDGALKSVSLDLICGLPGSTAATWSDSLRRAAGSGASHLSVYDLQVEPKTKFARLRDSPTASFDVPPEEAGAAMLAETSRTLQLAEFGFERYEVSSYSLPGHRSRHNSAYWRNDAFFGFGLGATSHIDSRRVARPTTLQGYEDWVRELEDRGWSAHHGEAQAELGVDALQTRIMLALRTVDGLDLSKQGVLRGQAVLGGFLRAGPFRGRLVVKKQGMMAGPSLGGLRATWGRARRALGARLWGGRAEPRAEP